ncbi:hypothetical protein AMS68_006384 [Peltaster fructicola]|uniref:Uncharacterized protein n=1 Tax=Peltaster fructicola TaxID=286661 RepID=A0A6H0Y1K9_9PEZI|nr:hypothetical protein AMS68_006384 [Peltaster fructicola]
MVPPLGKITSFFRPYVAKNKKQHYDGDNITVAARPSVSSDSSQKPLNPQLDSLARPISPRPSKEKLSRVPERCSTPKLIKHCGESTSRPTGIPQADHASPSSIHSTSPTTSLSVRTINLGEQLNTVIDESLPISMKPTPTNAVTSSFSSTSSRRVVVNGVKAVTNSDSDSVSSSSDEFEDAGSFMPRKRLKMTPPGADLTHAIVLHDDEEMKPGAAKPRWSMPAPKKYRHSLSNLVKQMEREEAITARIKQAEADVQQQSESKADVLAERASTDMFADDSDRERIKAAIDRIEACEESDMFYFFHGDQVQESIVKPAWGTLTSLLQEEGCRENVIRSRFLTDLAEQVGLSQDVLTWVYRSLQIEPSPLLCEEYLSILQASCQHKQVSVLQDFSLQTIYQGVEQGSTQSAGLPNSLRYNLRLLATLAAGSSPFDRVKGLKDIFLLNLDEHVRATPDMQPEIENALHAVLGSSQLDSKDVQSATGEILGHDVLSPQQMARGIATLPVTTAALHHFRRRLALQYMLKTDANIDMTSPATGELILEVLRTNPVLSVNSQTNWALMHWIVQLLDICIDAGFSDFTFMTDTALETQEEKRFNKQVDEVSQRLRLIANSIRDAGTSHLRRTEAKGALDRLVLRIELSVRTRPKRKAAVFGGRVGGGQQDLFKNFLAGESEDEDDGLQTQIKAPRKAPNRKTVKFTDSPDGVELK